MVPYGIDKEKFFLQIKRLREHLRKIEEIKKKYKDEEILIPLLERNLHLAVESCLNIGNHLISGFGFKRPDTYKEIFKILKEEKVIKEEIAEKMMELVSFRNRLVHLYWKVEEKEVIERANNLEIFDNFVKEVIKYLKEKRQL